MRRNRLAVALTLGLLLGTYGVANAAGLGKVSDIATTNKIYYGTYKQDKADDYSDTNKTYKTQGVAYRVLANDTANKKVTLLSDKILFANVFNASVNDGNKWSTSAIRTKLNDTTSTNSFINKSFTTTEQKNIADSTVNTDIRDNSGKVTGNYDTTQKIYLLSVNEANTYFADDASRVAQGTDYAKSGYNVSGADSETKLYTNSNGKGYWRLRSPGYNTFIAAFVGDFGDVLDNGLLVHYSHSGARPALQLNLDSVIFTSAAASGSGKSAATAGGGFITPSDIATDSTLKLTMKDEYDVTTNTTGQQEISSINVTDTANLGMTYTIANAYTDTENAKKANNQVIAGLIGDTSFANWTSYAKMAEFANGATEASGTASIAQAGPSGAALADGTYGLSLYSEQANDYDRTDWAGKFKKIFNIIVTNGSVDKMVLVSTDAADALTVDGSAGIVTLTSKTYNQELTATNNGTYKIGANEDTIFNGKVTLINSSLDNQGRITINNILNAQGDADLGNVILNGSIDMTDANGKGSFNKVTINEFNGNGNFIINTDLANNAGDTIAIGTANNATANLQIAYDPYFDTTTKNATLPGSYKVLTVGSGQMSAVNALTTDWGAIRFTPTIINNGDNTYNIGSLVAEQKFDPSENTMTAADARATLDALWRENNNNLSKRMGDLRLDQAGDDGIWARFQRSNNKLKGGRDANLHSNLFQAGVDKQFSRKNGKSYVGIAVDHSDGTGSYDNGSGDVKSTNVALYTTWIGNSGHYYDIILKQGHYSNEYDVTDLSGTRSHGDFGMNATTLSGEYGYRKHLKNGAYIEPQAELIYGHLSGDDYTTDLGWPVHVDGYNHFIARLGIAAGRETKQGNYYAKASYYHDFSGGGSIRFDTYSYERDAVKNWAELTLGGDLKLGKNWRAYGEVNKYFGDVRNSLNYDIGVRCSF